MSFLSVDGTLVVQLINFAIFFALLNVLFLRPVAAAIRRRREYINSLVSDYDQYQSEAASLREQAEAVRAAARRDAELQVGATRAQASNEAAAITTRYSEQAAKIVDEANATARGELESARAGEDAAARRVADFMLERAVPEASA